MGGSWRSWSGITNRGSSFIAERLLELVSGVPLTYLEYPCWCRSRSWEEGFRCRRSTRVPAVFSSGLKMGLPASSALSFPPSCPSLPRHHRRPPGVRARLPRAFLLDQARHLPDPIHLHQHGPPLALYDSIAAKGQHDLWKRKIEEVAEEVDSLKESLEKLLIRQQKRMMEAKERAELFQRANGESEHVLRIFDEEAQAIQSARNSSMMLEEAYDTGVAVLSKYAEQRDHLKRAQRKALDILNTVGLSNSVLKLIERRHRVDCGQVGCLWWYGSNNHRGISVLEMMDALICG